MKGKPIDITSYESKKKFKRHHKFLIAGAAITAASFLLTLVPCQIKGSKLSVPGFCKLPNPLVNLTTTDYFNYYYYGISNNPITGLLIQFIVGVLISYLVVYGFKKLNFKRKNYKIIDYTKK